MKDFKMTISTVKGIPLAKPGTKEIYWCDDLPGFAVKATSTTKTFIVQAKIGGTREGRSITRFIGRTNEMSLSEAKERAKQALIDIRSGIDLNVQERQQVKQQQAQSLTLAQLFTDYISKRDLRPRTKQTYEDALRLCIPDWCNRPVTSITRDMIEDRLQTITVEPGVRGNRKAQAMQCFTLLRALFRFAAERYEDANGSPVIQAIATRNIARGKAWSKISVRDNVIHPDDLESWYQAAINVVDPVLRDYVLFLMFSGLRRTEALQLKWSYIDIKKSKVLTIPPEVSKNGKKRQIPLSDELLNILQHRHDNRIVGNDYIFPGKKPRQHLVEPRRGINSIRKATGITWTLHDLRRTFATVASRLDISYYKLKHLLGHAVSGDVTGNHYVQVDVETLRPEMQKITNYLKEHMKMHGSLQAVSTL